MRYKEETQQLSPSTPSPGPNELPYISVGHAPGYTVKEILINSGVPERHFDRLDVRVNDFPCSFDYVPKDGEKLEVKVYGGGGGGGKQILQIVAVIAVVIASVYLGPITAGYLGVTSSAGIAATTAAISMVGMMAINAIFAPPSPNMGTAGYGTQKNSQYFTGSSNQKDLLGYIPVYYGKNKVFPNVASKELVINSGDTSFMSVLFDFGLGDYDVTDISIGDTPITQYDVEKQNLFYNTNKPALEVVNAVLSYNQFNYRLLKDDEFIVRTAPTTNRAILDLQFPRGLVHFDNNGNAQNASADIEIKFRKLGDTVWSTLPRGDKAFTGASVTTIGTDVYQLTSNNSSPLIVAVEMEFPTLDTYEISVTRRSDISTSTRTYNAAHMHLLRSYENTSVLNLPDSEKHTWFELHLKANDQLSGSLNNVSAITVSKLRTHDGTSWQTPIPTSNPAWIALDILTNPNLRAPLEDSQLDFQTFVDFAKKCDEVVSHTINGVVHTGPRYTFNGKINGDETVREVLQKVLIGAKAQLTLMSSGKYGIIQDLAKTSSVQMFTPSNSWNFSGSKTYSVDTHAFRVRYVEPTNDYKVTEVVVYKDGYNEANAKNFETLDTFGCTNYREAYSYARYMLAQATYRNEQFSIDIDLESLVVQRGDRVEVSHYVPATGGTSAVVSEIDLPNSAITLDRDILLGSNPLLRLRLKDGNIVTVPITGYA